MQPPHGATVLLLAGLIWLAGCVGPSPRGGDVGASPAGASPVVQDSAAGRADEPAPDPSGGAASPGAKQMFEFQGNVTLAAWHAAGVGDDGGGHAFDVLPGALAIRAVLAWNGTATDLDATLLSPGFCKAPLVPMGTLLVGGIDCSLHKALRATGDGWFQNPNGTPATPDNPSALVVDAEDIVRWGACDAAACTWVAFPWTTSAVAATYTYRIEVTYPPEAMA